MSRFSANKSCFLKRKFLLLTFCFIFDDFFAFQFFGNFHPISVMANILKLSTRPSDLLNNEQNGQPSEPTSDDSMLAKNLPKKAMMDQAPESKFVAVPHEIVSENDRRITVAGLVNQRRTLGGTAHAEHYIR
jgi:hypothetical protein